MEVLLRLPAAECCESYYLIRGCKHRFRWGTNSPSVSRRLTVIPRKRRGSRQRMGSCSMTSYLEPISEDWGPENPMLPPAFVAENSWGSASTEQKPEPVMSSRIGRWKKKLQWLNWERKRWTKRWRGWVRTEQPEPGDKTVGSFVIGAKHFPSRLWRDVLSSRRQWQRREPFRPMSPRFTVIFLYVPAALLSLQDHCEWHWCWQTCM